jgi:hypothetical protein
MSILTTMAKVLPNYGYMAPEGDPTGGGGGGSGGGETPEQKAAREEAERKKEAEQKDGKKPTDEEAKLLKEVMEKKNALKTATDELARVKEQLKQFEGIDPAKVKELLKAQADAEAAKKAAEEAKLKAEGNWDALKKQMNEAHKKELDAKNAEILEIQGRERTLQSIIAELTVGNAFGNSKFIAEEMSLTPAKTRALFGSHFEFKDGKMVGYDRPAGASDRTMLIDGKGEPLSFEEAIKKIVAADPDSDQLVKSKLKQGAGSGTLNGGKPGDGTKELSSREKIAKGLAEAAKKK